MEVRGLQDHLESRAFRACLDLQGLQAQLGSVVKEERQVQGEFRARRGREDPLGHLEPREQKERGVLPENKVQKDIVVWLVCRGCLDLQVLQGARVLWATLGLLVTRDHLVLRALQVVMDHQASRA